MNKTRSRARHGYRLAVCAAVAVALFFAGCAIYPSHEEPVAQKESFTAGEWAGAILLWLVGGAAQSHLSL